MVKGLEHTEARGTFNEKGQSKPPFQGPTSRSRLVCKAAVRVKTYQPEAPQAYLLARRVGTWSSKMLDNGSAQN